jgi:hypothetical protein
MTGEVAAKSMIAIVAIETATGIVRSAGIEGRVVRRVAIVQEIEIESESEMPIGRDTMTAPGNVVVTTGTMAIAGPPRGMTGMTGETGEKKGVTTRATGIAGDLYQRMNENL